MNSVAEQAGQDQGEQQEGHNVGTIWNFESDGNRLIISPVPSTSHYGRFTTTELCQRIRSFGDSKEGTLWIEIRRYDSFECPSSDLQAVGQALHDLQCFQTLRIDIWYLAAEKVSAVLRYVPRTIIRALHISLARIVRIPTILDELRRDHGFPCLRNLKLGGAHLDEGDCESLAHWLKSRERKAEFRLSIYRCTFPSLTTYLVVANALIGSFPSFHVTVSRIRVENASIASFEGLADPTSDVDFYNIFDRKNRVTLPDGKVDVLSWRFSMAVQDHLNLYRDLNLGGRLNLMNNDNMPLEDWVGSLCHESVTDSINNLFYFLKLNPDVYAKAAISRRAVKEEEADAEAVDAKHVAETKREE